MAPAADSTPRPASPGDDSTAFRLADVSVRFGDLVALAPTELSIDRGETVALVGPSGSGKTTLLRLLNGTQRASTGHVTALGHDLATISRPDLRRLRSTIGFVPQHLGLLPNVRVIHNVVAGAFGRTSFAGSLRLLVRPPRDVMDRVDALLERVGIADKMFERTDRLSGGQQQRVAIARALFQDPVALLADEPVSSVDPARARDTIELLTRIGREDGRVLVTSLHDVELARACFPRLIGLRGGSIALDGAPSELDDAAFEPLFALGPSPTAPA